LKTEITGRPKHIYSIDPKNEKEKRTFEFLQATPTSPAEVVIAKSLTGLVYCFLVSLIILIANREHIQAVPYCILATILGAIFIVFLGLLLGLFVCKFDAG